jgi:hypothetical protein
MLPFLLPPGDTDLHDSVDQTDGSLTEYLSSNQCYNLSEKGLEITYSARDEAYVSIHMRQDCRGNATHISTLKLPATRGMKTLRMDVSEFPCVDATRAFSIVFTGTSLNIDQVNILNYQTPHSLEPVCHGKLIDMFLDPHTKKNSLALPRELHSASIKSSTANINPVRSLVFLVLFHL